MRIAITAVLALALGVTVALAQEREFRLKDGGVVRGELLSRENHVYQIKTKTMGIVSVKDSDIIGMDSAPPRRGIITPEMFKQNPVVTKKTSPAAPAQPAVPIPDITQKIMGDPAVVESMVKLASDPMLLDMMADPQIKAALASNDLEFLKNNEKFLSFMNNPAVKDLTKKLLEGTPQEKQQQR